MYGEEEPFMSQSHSGTRTLVEGALMVALSTVFSMIQIPLMPHGGSITLFSMLPILLMSYRHGAAWGLLTAFLNSLVQLVQGISNLAYCQTLGAQVGCVLLDYLLAFTVLGLACVFARPFRNAAAGVGVSAFVVCLLRYLCSFLSGYIVWKDYEYAFSWMSEIRFPGISGLSEDALCWLYSAVYNATYMIPEAILTTAAAVILFRTAPRLFEADRAR